jgi:hypothetical protein
MPEQGLQVAWNHVSLDYPDDHPEHGKSLVLDRDTLVPEDFPLRNADILVTIGALRRVIVVETEAELTKRLVAEGQIPPGTAVAGRLGDLLEQRQGEQTDKPVDKGTGQTTPVPPAATSAKPTTGSTASSTGTAAKK